ncbi:hypothetical protein Nmel_003329, partial [Mimus melanotis]
HLSTLPEHSSFIKIPFLSSSSKYLTKLLTTQISCVKLRCFHLGQQHWFESMLLNVTSKGA